MFITENVNFEDSVLFLLSARATLKEMIELSNVEEKDNLKEFIVKEATDYQVMSLLVTGELPEEASNPVAEGLVYSRLKDQLIRNYSDISELIEPSLINNIIFEVDSLPVGESTTSIFSENEKKEEKLGYLSEAPFMTKSKSTDAYNTLKSDPSKKSVGFMTKSHSADAYKNQTGLEKDASGWWQTAINKGKGVMSTVAQWTKDHPDASKGIGAGILAAIATYAAYKIYKRFLSKAARACKGDADKSACMAKFKDQAKQAQIKELKKGVSACSKSSDPGKCKTVINNKIAKLMTKK